MSSESGANMINIKFALLIYTGLEIRKQMWNL